MTTPLLDSSPVSRRALLASAGAVTLGAVASTPVRGEASWELTLGGRGRDLFRDVALADSDGYLVGVTSGDGADSAWVVRIHDGRPVWLETYGDGDARATSVVLGPDGGAVVAGARVAAGTDTERGWVFAVDADGEVRWEQSFSGTNGVARSVALAPDGDVLVAGRAESGLIGVQGWLARVTPDGDVRWVRSYGRDLKIAFNAVAAVDGEPLVAGLASPRGDRGDGFLASVASGGGLRDRRRYDLDGLAAGVTALAPGPDGPIVAGTREGPPDHFDLWAAAVGSDGRRWTETYGRSRRDRLADAVRTPDGGALLVGRTDERSGSARDAWVVKIDDEGAKEWARTFGGSGDDRADGVAVDGDAYVVAGKWTRGRDGPQGWVTRRSLDDAPPSVLPEAVPSVGVAGGLAGVAGAVALGALRRRSRDD